MHFLSLSDFREIPHTFGSTAPFSPAAGKILSEITKQRANNRVISRSPLEVAHRLQSTQRDSGPQPRLNIAADKMKWRRNAVRSLCLHGPMSSVYMGTG
ncbi:hypothetical protein RRG08_033728 [Elysia crispata]|uniref:Uncharacterized protein n=1 Tax=Elysia crispata TaxID=231223 RepID=A0AAE1AA36_9GAST|nr:hypothetical protein RRG08_033728 [Elysia crispata]